MKFKGPNQKFVTISSAEIDRDIALQKKIKEQLEADPDWLERKLWELLEDMDIEETLSEEKEKEDGRK